MQEIRLCASEADEEASLAIYNEVWPWDAVTMDEVRSFKSQTLEYADFLGEGGSAVVGVTAQRPDVGFVLLTVLPAHRGRGLGSALCRTALSWLSARDIAQTDAPVPEGDDHSMSFALRRGFREVERNGRMILDLTALEPAPVAPPNGIEIVTWADRPDLARGIYDVACEASPDVPGDREKSMEPFEDWLAHEMQGPGDRPDATFLALAEDEVVGYAKFSLTPAQPETAHHDLTGVKREWRRRGIAGALKRAQISWAKDQGYRTLATHNELRNEPIRRLNERLGYHEAPGRVIMRGPCSSSSTSTRHSS